jgi:hypothetical protein
VLSPSSPNKVTSVKHRYGPPSLDRAQTTEPLTYWKGRETMQDDWTDRLYFRKLYFFLRKKRFEEVNKLYDCESKEQRVTTSNKNEKFMLVTTHLSLGLISIVDCQRRKCVDAKTNWITTWLTNDITSVKRKGERKSKNHLLAINIWFFSFVDWIER